MEDIISKIENTIWEVLWDRNETDNIESLVEETIEGILVDLRGDLYSWFQEEIEEEE